MSKISDFEDKLIKNGMSNEDFEEYKKLLKKVRGNFAKQQHCYNTATDFPPEHIAQAIQLIRYGLDAFPDSHFSTYQSYLHMGQIYENAKQYQDAYNIYSSLLGMLREVDQGLKPKLCGKLCWMCFYMNHFQYSDELEKLYSDYDNMENLSISYYEDRIQRLILQIVIASFHKQNDIAEEAYKQAIEIYNPYHVEEFTDTALLSKYQKQFGVTPELHLFLKELKNKFSWSIEETRISATKTDMHQYRKELLENNFIEPELQDLSSKHWLFFRPATRLTAFIVNLKQSNKGIEVIYGYGSTAFTLMNCCENSLNESGIDDDDITIRKKVLILPEDQTHAAANCISEMYQAYRYIEKDELLKIARQQRKEFINKIAVRLKPLGFKKKKNSWKKFLNDEFYIMFEAQKSSFSDEYYFNIFIDTDKQEFGRECFYCRVFPEELCPLDWQLYPHDKFISFLEDNVIALLSHIINTPLAELGKEKMIWEGCNCERDICNVCWVEKNLWEMDIDEEFI